MSKNTVKMDCFGCGLWVCRRRSWQNCKLIWRDSSFEKI
nr:MAG TPA: hypothetical protein [Caudoviricetes sp.]